MNWGEFKAAVEAQGINDADTIDYIDWSGPAGDWVNAPAFAGKHGRTFYVNDVWPHRKKEVPHEG